MNPIIASVWFVFLKNIPRRNVPSKPPYVNDAIERPNSTTGFLESLNNIAPPIKTIPQNNVNTLDQNISFLGSSSLPFFVILNRSRYVDDANELIADESVPI